MRTGVLVVLVVTGVLIAGPAATTAAGQSTDPVTLTVSVVDQEGNPVGEAELSATWENGSTTGTTASNGKAFLDVDRGANVTIELSHPEYVRNDPFVVRNATEQDVTIPVFQQAQLSVVVADDSGPVADARIVLRKDGRIVSQERTNESGVFTSETIEEGEYTVAAVKSGYFRNLTIVEVGPSTQTRIAIERGTVSLTVAVQDSHFSPPRSVSNATVDVESVGTLRTLDSGAASVRVPVNTVLSVAVDKQGYNDVTRRVRVAESDLRVNVTTNRTPSLRLDSISRRVVAGEQIGVEVVDEYSDPVEDATILLDGESVGSTGADGRATVTIEEPGNHTIAAETDDLNSDSVTVRAIAEDEETPTQTQTPTPVGTSPESGFSVPGFTPLTAVLAIAASLAILLLRRR